MGPKCAINTSLGWLRSRHDWGGEFLYEIDLLQLSLDHTEP